MTASPIEMFLERTGNHARACMLYDPSHYVLQCLDYLDNIDIYKDRIRMFHVKDAEFNPTGRQGVYGGYQNWVNAPAASARSATARSISAPSSPRWLPMISPAGRWWNGNARMKHPEDGAREGAEFVKAATSSA
jgi:sugar phosphate isomerase/epimerase